MFSQPQIKALFSQYVLLKLFCDTVPPEYEPTTSAAENRQFLQEKYGTAQLPFYAIIKPTGNGKFETIGVYDEGKINFVDKFADFLRKPLAM